MTPFEFRTLIPVAVNACFQDAPGDYVERMQDGMFWLRRARGALVCGAHPTLLSARERPAPERTRTPR